jgi:hypothetical protein
MAERTKQKATNKKNKKGIDEGQIQIFKKSDYEKKEEHPPIAERFSVFFISIELIF